MPFQSMQDFTFKHSEQQDALYAEYTAQQIKALFDSRGEELRTALNLLVTALNSVEGASNIGTQSIQDVDGETIQAMLKSIRDNLKSRADGSSGADYINATAIEGLTGNTVQSLLESLKAYTDINVGGVKASTVSADPIAVGSGTTVQAQLAWLLSQIAVAATGSIPDGSLTEAKLAQTLVDKINKALSNVGVLTTLLTNDKSSLVNALNEHLEDDALIKHKAKQIGLEDTNNLFTSSELEGAMIELFTNVSNGKALVGTAITDVDPNVTVPTEPTFSDLGTAIRNISAGKKYASGTFNNLTTNSFSIVLGFTPSRVVVELISLDSGNTTGIYTFSDTPNFKTMKSTHQPKHNSWGIRMYNNGSSQSIFSVSASLSNNTFTFSTTESSFTYYGYNATYYAYE